MGGSWKKSGAKRKAAAKPAKYTVLPATPEITRSSASRKSGETAPIEVVVGARPPSSSAPRVEPIAVVPAPPVTPAPS